MEHLIITESLTVKTERKYQLDILFNRINLFKFFFFTTIVTEIMLNIYLTCNSFLPSFDTSNKKEQ